LCLTLLAALSTAAGFQVARFQGVWPKLLGTYPVQAASSFHPSPSLVSDSKPAASNEMETISHLAPQQQAERLLDLAIHRQETSLALIDRNLDAWRGRLENTDHLFHLVLAALESEDPRVRTAALEIDLAASNLSKSPQSVAHLLSQISNDPGSRSLTLWRLGALGNRGVEPAIVLTTLLRYAHDRNQQTRFWAVEGLAMLGTDESIDPLLSILAHDSSRKIRERAACNLARSGMLTGEQRLTAVPQLLNLLDDDSLDAATQDLVYAALRSITGASFGKDADAWREWWAHHDRPENPRHIPRGLSVA
jgi:HEAT repeat protein